MKIFKQKTNAFLVAQLYVGELIVFFAAINCVLNIHLLAIWPTYLYIILNVGGLFVAILTRNYLVSNADNQLSLAPNDNLYPFMEHRQSVKKALFFGLLIYLGFIRAQGANVILDELKKENSPTYKNVGGNLCDVYFQSGVNHFELDERGACSYMIYTRFNAKPKELSKDRTFKECIETIKNGCDSLCGYYTKKSSGDQIFSIVMNFGQNPDFNGFHFPFSSSKRVAIISCNRDLFHQRYYKQQTEKKIIDSITF